MTAPNQPHAINAPTHSVSAQNDRSGAPYRRLAAAALLVVFAAASLFAAPSRESSHAWLDVDTGAYADNVREFKKVIGDQTGICAIMKADGYGCGLEMLVPVAIAEKIPAIGIASNEEAAKIRACGYTGRIVRVRTATAGEIRTGLPYDIEELIGALLHARAADAIAAEAGRLLKFHLALNAGGMDRNGLDMTLPGSLDEAVAIIRLPHLKITGMMTHYPMEECTDVRPRLARFNAQTAAIIGAAKLDRRSLTLHTANSFAALNVPEARLDMVRPGSVLYQGGCYDGFPQFKTVFSFKTRVASVNAYPKGSTICYDRTCTLTRDSRLANLPVGYSDGYLRAFGNKGRVLVNGHSAKIMGVITMNTFMVDVTDFPDVKPGDEVVLFGAQGSDEITDKEIEKTSGMPFYELQVLWGKLNPRFQVGR